MYRLMTRFNRGITQNMLTFRSSKIDFNVAYFSDII